MLVAMGRWMDDAIPLVPNRYSAALISGNGSGTFSLVTLLLCLLLSVL